MSDTISQKEVKPLQVREVVGNLEHHAVHLNESLRMLEERVDFVSQQSPPALTNIKEDDATVSKDQSSGIPICNELQSVMDSILKSKEIVDDILKRLEI